MALLSGHQSSRPTDTCISCRRPCGVATPRTSALSRRTRPPRPSRRTREWPRCGAAFFNASVSSEPSPRSGSIWALTIVVRGRPSTFACTMSIRGSVLSSRLMSKLSTKVVVRGAGDDSTADLLDPWLVGWGDQVNFPGRCVGLLHGSQGCWLSTALSYQQLRLARTLRWQLQSLPKQRLEDSLSSTMVQVCALNHRPRLPSQRPCTLARSFNRGHPFQTPLKGSP